jgi:phage regulator Rha-like protein
MKKDLSIVSIEIVERKIYLIRGMKVMLDSDLAELYDVPTFRLNEAVKRNKGRFPSDFMFQLTEKESKNLRCQFGTLNLTSQIAMSSSKHGGRRYMPFVFTEHGVAMLSSVLKSKKAVQVNILIVRAFIKLRELLATHKDLILEIDKIKREQKNQSQKINSVINIISQMLNPPINENKEPIGFKEREEKKKE